MTEWSVYMLRCRDGSIYTGIATDVARRVIEHQESRGKGAKSLRGKGPLHVVLEKKVGALEVALGVENRIKKLRKTRKEELVRCNGQIERMIRAVERGVRGKTRMLIREYREPGDQEGLRRCVIALQDFERGLDPRLPEGAIVADACLETIFDTCRKYLGKIFVAVVNEGVVGYASVWARARTEDPEAGPREYALVSDLVVLEEYRGKGIGKRLLERAEEYARQRGAKLLRVCVLAKNRLARELYVNEGFGEWEIELEKEL